MTMSSVLRGAVSDNDSAVAEPAKILLPKHFTSRSQATYALFPTMSEAVWDGGRASGRSRQQR